MITTIIKGTLPIVALGIFATTATAQDPATIAACQDVGNVGTAFGVLRDGGVTMIDAVNMVIENNEILDGDMVNALFTIASVTYEDLAEFTPDQIGIMLVTVCLSGKES